MNQLSIDNKTLIHCSKCKEKKPPDQFGRDKRRPRGRSSWCKKCYCIKSRAYRRTARGRQSIRKCNKRWRQSKKGQEDHRIRSKEYRQKYPQKIKARKAIEVAIRTGKIVKASSSLCDHCGQQAQHYHHNSYEPENRLNVQALCNSCHTSTHRTIA